MAADTIHLYINPTAGRGRAGRRQERIIELLKEKGINPAVHTSSAAGDIESQLYQHVNAGASRIIVAGGDGSVHEAVNGLLRSDNSASLGVIPIGTGNDFAKACDITLNWEHATQLLADRIVANATPRPLDAGRCNDRYFANGAGIGFDAKVNRVAHSIRLPIGDFVYLLAIFRTMIGGVSSPRVKIEADGFSWDGPLTLAAVCNGQWVGGMFHIAPTASNADHFFDLLIARPVTRRRILTLLPKLISGSHLQEKEIVHKPVTRLTIKADSALPSHLDGEIQPLQKTFEIAILPGALNLL
jgi:YegS/Rv2252/BmrU family lipid kinase